MHRTITGTWAPSRRMGRHLRLLRAPQLLAGPNSAEEDANAPSSRRSHLKRKSSLDAIDTNASMVSKYSEGGSPLTPGGLHHVGEKIHEDDHIAHRAQSFYVADEEHPHAKELEILKEHMGS